MPTWYALIWTGDGGRCWQGTRSFSTVADAKSYAREKAPEWATHFSIRNTGGEYVVEGALEGSR
jgi:hypothetical protein